MWIFSNFFVPMPLYPISRNEVAGIWVVRGLKIEDEWKSIIEIEKHLCYSGGKNSQKNATLNCQQN